MKTLASQLQSQCSSHEPCGLLYVILLFKIKNLGGIQLSLNTHPDFPLHWKPPTNSNNWCSKNNPSCCWMFDSVKYKQASTRQRICNQYTLAPVQNSHASGTWYLHRKWISERKITLHEKQNHRCRGDGVSENQLHVWWQSLWISNNGNMAILWFLSRIPQSGSSSHPPPPCLPFVVSASQPDGHSNSDREESQARCHQLLACSSSPPPDHSYLHSASLPSPSLIIASSLFNGLSPLSLLTHKVLSLVGNSEASPSSLCSAFWLYHWLRALHSLAPTIFSAYEAIPPFFARRTPNHPSKPHSQWPL